MTGFLARLYYMTHPPSQSGIEAAENPVKFGCLGAAKIAPGALVSPSQTHPEVVLYAVAARDKSRADAFAAKHGFQKSYGSYQELIDDPEVDAIYNPLPNGLHFEWTMKALQGGKHVLLEKPATDTADEARQIFALAEKKGLVVLEAFHYRFHPAIQRVKAILDSKELGPISSITAGLTAPAGTVDKDDIRFDYELGGGSTMDPGSYSVNAVRYLASSYPTAIQSASATRYSPERRHEQVDRSFKATLEFDGGVIGDIFADLSEPRFWGIIPRLPKLSATIHCEGGDLEIYNFLIPMYYHSITVSPKGGHKRVEKAYSFNGKAKGEDWWTTYRYQLEAFVDKVQGRTPQTWIEPEDTIDNMRLIEEIYAKDGFGSRPRSKYVFEPENKD